MLHIEALPAFTDNYIWLLTRDGSRAAAVVDPGDPDVVLAALAARGLTLDAVLITHHHRDHTGGIARLKAAFPRAVVPGPAGERIAGLTRRLVEDDQVEVLGARFRVLDVPGHTAGHIAYVGEAPDAAGVLFCGDTLFAGGCGRLFEGTPEQMTASLAKLAALPGDTRVYCAHEYTLANLGFAAWVEPDSPALLARVADDAARRRRDEPTVPSTLALERATNPFLRVREPAVIAAAERFTGQRLATDSEVFWAVRHWKDTEYD